MTKYLNSRFYDNLVVGDKELLDMHQSLSMSTKFILSTFFDYSLRTTTISDLHMKCLYYDEGPVRNILLSNTERKRIFNAIDKKITEMKLKEALKEITINNRMHDSIDDDIDDIPGLESVYDRRNAVFDSGVDPSSDNFDPFLPELIDPVF
jgi:hypothetical protein